MSSSMLPTVTGELVDKLIKFKGRAITDELACIQRNGTVAIYNKLVSAPTGSQIAYLADEVGMGKTYIALGVLAVMRHFRPNMRAVVIAPRKHMQDKWVRDQRNFVRDNYLLEDLAVKDVDGTAIRPLYRCENLVDFAQRSVLEHDHDFLLRMSSFSLAVAKADNGESQDKRRNKTQYEDLVESVLGSKKLAEIDWEHEPAKSKRLVGEAINRLLRPIDLLIVDEAHNLKHGINDKVAFRNQVLQEVFANKAEHVLLLSATPVESSYRELYNQVNVFGMADPLKALCDDNAKREEQKELAKKILIRRVYSLKAKSGSEYTRNQYRREWRGGGVKQYDNGMDVERTVDRLVMGLMQLKVQEALGRSAFPHAFQMGLLASFESYGQTVSKKEIFESDGTQTVKMKQYEGADVNAINAIADRYRQAFKDEMPHPKMDQLRDVLSLSWNTGEKSIVFVRRVASATEMVNKLNEHHDQWLLRRLIEYNPDKRSEFEEVYELYLRDRRRVDTSTRTQATPTDTLDGVVDDPMLPPIEDDENNASFFAWFFRTVKGKKKRNEYRTGGWMQRTLNSSSSLLSTLFEFNDVAAILGCEPGEVMGKLNELLSTGTNQPVEDILSESVSRYLPKESERSDTVQRTQAAIINLLSRTVDEHDPIRSLAARLYEKKYAYLEAIPAAEQWNEERATARERKGRQARVRNALKTLSEDTFWSALERDGRSVFDRIRFVIAINSRDHEPDDHQLFARELARELMTNVLRRSHAAIDLYSMVIRQHSGLLINDQKQTDDADPKMLIKDLLDHMAKEDSRYRSINELNDIAGNIHTIITLNIGLTATDHSAFRKIRKVVSSLVRNIVPAVDMTGGAPDRIIKQFRFPGYPFVLVATDVISEGQDLHTFCSSVYHYGIAWMPSSMEQRTGRIDRVNSKTERRLIAADGPIADTDKLQVYLPYLGDTIEVVQVHRVLHRMNEFLLALHDDLQGIDAKSSQVIELDKEGRTILDVPKQLTERLKTSFDVDRDRDLAGQRNDERVSKAEIIARKEMMKTILENAVKGDTVGRHELHYVSARRSVVSGETDRQQTYTCRVRTLHGHTIIECSSLIGVIEVDKARKILAMPVSGNVRVMNGAEPDSSTFDCWVKGEVYVDSLNVTESVAVVRRLIDDVTVTADAIEQVFFDGADQDELALSAIERKQYAD